MTGLDLETFLSLSSADVGIWASAAFAAGLLGILAWTSWGPRRLLRRCLAASLLVHAGLLAAGGQAALSLRAFGPPPADAAPDGERIQQIVVLPEDPSGDVAGAAGRAGAGTEGEGGTGATGPLAPWQRPGALAAGPRPDDSAPRPAPAPREARPTLLAMGPIGADAGTPAVEAPPTAAPEDRPGADATSDAPPEPPPAVAATPADEAELPAVADAPRRVAAAARPTAVEGLLAAETAPRPRPPARPAASPLDLDAAGAPAAEAAPDVPVAGSPDATPRGPAATGDLAADAPAPGDPEPVAAASPSPSRPRAAAPRLAMPGLDDLSAPRPAAAAPRVGRTAPAEALAIASATPRGVAGPGAGPGRDPIASRPLPEVPEVYRPRLDPNRSARAQRDGASAASEEAVERALAWLARHQDADGRWDAATMRDGGGVPVPGDDDYTVHCPPGDVCFGECHYWEADTALTGLSLLAYLGAGYTHRDGKAHSRTVAKGLDYLLAIQRPDGDLRGDSRTIGLYCHCMAALALSEAYALTGDPRLRDPVERAVAFLVRARSINGMSWRYAPGAPDGDTSLLGWVILVLKSAKEVGIPVPAAVQQGATRWLTLVAGGRNGGLASYQPGKPANPTMTAEAWVCRQFLGVGGPSPASTEAASYLLERPTDRGEFNIYYWYYGTLALYQHGGEPWTRWNTRVRDEVLRRQKPDGHQAGSWDPDDSEYGKFGGRVYATALATLTLEVYYRYLRLYDDPAAPPQLAPGREPGSDPTLRRTGAGTPAPRPAPPSRPPTPLPRRSPL
jgi:hypothetical protein